LAGTIGSTSQRGEKTYKEGEYEKASSIRGFALSA